MENQFKKRILSTLILAPVVFYLVYLGSYLFNSMLILLFFLSIYELLKFKLNKFYLLLGFFYILTSFYYVYLFRNLNNDNNIFYFCLVLIICISTDIGGYVFGKTLKGPKLTIISPNKTYSGVIGSYILTIITISIYLIFLEKVVFLNLKFFYIVIAISTVSQFGDLLISVMKRISKIKDTGNLIPGHGGLLDRIDGMLLAFPFSYLIFYK